MLPRLPLVLRHFLPRDLVLKREGKRKKKKKVKALSLSLPSTLKQEVEHICSGSERPSRSILRITLDYYIPSPFPILFMSGFDLSLSLTHILIPGRPTRCKHLPEPSPPENRTTSQGTADPILLSLYLVYPTHLYSSTACPQLGGHSIGVVCSHLTALSSPRPPPKVTTSRQRNLPPQILT